MRKKNTFPFKIPNNNLIINSPEMPLCYHDTNIK